MAAMDVDSGSALLGERNRAPADDCCERLRALRAAIREALDAGAPRRTVAAMAAAEAAALFGGRPPRGAAAAAPGAAGASGPTAPKRTRKRGRRGRRKPKKQEPTGGAEPRAAGVAAGASAAVAPASAARPTAEAPRTTGEGLGEPLGGRRRKRESGATAAIDNPVPMQEDGVLGDGGGRGGCAGLPGGVTDHAPRRLPRQAPQGAVCFAGADGRQDLARRAQALFQLGE